MSSSLSILERHIPKNLNCLYVLNRPVYQVRPDNQLVPAKEYADAGAVTAIIQDDTQRYHVTFERRNELTLTAKKVVMGSTTAIKPSYGAFLQAFGYRLALPPVSPQSHQEPAVMPTGCQLTNMPTAYVILDCEFGTLFRRTNATNAINWQIFKALGLKTNIFQLSAISFDHHQQRTIFFNRYFDNQYFLPEKKLLGLAETGLTLADYEHQGATLTIIKAFITQVLQPGLPLVFWDQTQDLKYLRRLLITYFDQLTPTEQKIATTPLTIFDAQAFTNTLINHGNHKVGSHDLPLNGLAALFNVTNPHQHNAIWDVQTIELVLRHLTRLAEQTPAQPVQPAPIFATTRDATDPQSRHAKYALVQKLHARGKTYREIAAVTGISISGVNYILKKAVPTSQDHGVVRS